MRHAPNTASWRIGAIAACLIVAACAAPPDPEAPDPASGLAAPRLAQLGHGRQATFGFCHGDACPQRTPKTMSPARGTSPAPGVSTSATLLPALADGPLDAVDWSSPFASTPLSNHRLSVHFPSGSAHLDETARAALREATPRLQRARQITLSGRTDGTGSAAANALLARARADAVLRELRARLPGIDSVVLIHAQGACCYLEPNDTAAGRARNRRVEIRYVVDGDDSP